MKIRRHHLLLSSTAFGFFAVSAGLLLSIHPASAQSATPASSDANTTVQQSRPIERRKSVLEEVVVTASRKRKEDVQHTPIAVTALSGALLERAHVTSFEQIGSMAPNLEVGRNTGTAGVVSVYYRGFGQRTNDPAVDPHVAVFVDGIYQPSVSGTFFDLFDVGQVEVDGGPQGTLLGKNAPIGAIYITSALPSKTFGGAIQAEYGSYDHYAVRAKINVPLLKDSVGQTILTSRLSVADNQGGNWVYNEPQQKRNAGGVSTESVKLALDFTPTPEFEWILNGSFTHDNSPQGDAYQANYISGKAGTIGSVSQGTPYACLFLGPAGCPILPYDHSGSGFTTRPHSTQENVASNMHYSFAPVTVTLVSGYSGYQLHDNEDAPGTTFVSLNAYDDVTRFSEQTSELRISSNKGKGADLDGFVDWVAGAYFSNFDYTFSQNLGIGILDGYQLPQGVINSTQTQHGNTKSEALFTHAIFNFTSQFAGTFGFRHSWDQKNHSLETGGGPYGYDPEADFSNNTFEGGLSYQVDPHKLVYVRFAQGYESGGFAGFALGNTYQPETNNAYEIGIKTDLLNRHLRINADVFRNELANLQLVSSGRIPTPPGFLQETLNAGAAIVQGVEVQLIAVPIPPLTLHTNLGFLDSHYSENQSTVCSNDGLPADCSGISVSESPKWTVSVGGDYLFDLPRHYTADLSMNMDYKSSMFVGDPPYPASYQKGYALVSAGVVFKDPTERYAFEVYGTNILNQHYLVDFTDPGGGIAVWGEHGTPAEWGIKLTGKF